MSRNRATVIAIAAAFIVPWLLIAVAAWRRGGTHAWPEPGMLLSNWAYMVAPAALLTVCLLPFATARRRFLPGALALLCAVLVVFQGWVWWVVPVRESGLAWVLYYPAAVVALLSFALVAIVVHWRRPAAGPP